MKNNTVLIVGFFAAIMIFVFFGKDLGMNLGGSPGGNGGGAGEGGSGGGVGTGGVGGTIPGGSSEPPETPPPPADNGGGDTTDTPLNTNFGEGARLIKEYMSNAVKSNYGKVFRTRMNIGTNLFPFTRKNVSPAIEAYVIGHVGGSESVDVPLVPPTVDPAFLSKLERYVSDAGSGFDPEKKMDKLGKSPQKFFDKHLLPDTDFSSWGFRLLPGSFQQVMGDVIDKYGSCGSKWWTNLSPIAIAAKKLSGNSKEEKCIRSNFYKLSGREIKSIVNKMIGETKRLEKELRLEAIQSLIQSGYKFTDVA